MKMIKKIGLGAAALVGLLVLLILINPRINPSHTSPYLKLVEETQAELPAEEEILQRILLYGDAGHSALDPWQASMERVAARAAISPGKTAVVALGDNIYMQGYPQKEPGQQDWDEEQLESISFLDAQLQVARASGAAMYLVPGNHDWYATELDSQAAHIEDYTREHGVTIEFHPHHEGKPPLPTAVNLNGASLVFIDSEWMLHAEEPVRGQALERLETVIREIRLQHPGNLVIINAHHPLETMGQHGGYLAEFAHWFFIRLIYTACPQAANEDTFSPLYQQMIADLNGVIGKFDRTLYAAGHEHSLQVFGHDNAEGNGPEYTLVSRAANTSKLSGVWHNENTRFALSQEGFMELLLTGDGVYLQIFDVHTNDFVAGFWLEI